MSRDLLLLLSALLSLLLSDRVRAEDDANQVKPHDLEERGRSVGFRGMDIIAGGHIPNGNHAVKRRPNLGKGEQRLHPLTPTEYTAVFAAA